MTKKKLSCFLSFDRPGFDCYYKVFCKTGCLTEEAIVYSTVKATVMIILKKTNKLMKLSVVVWLHISIKMIYFARFVSWIVFSRKPASTPRPSSFFFRVAEMKNLNLLQFAIYRVAIMMSYKRLSKTFGSDIKPFSLLSSTPTPFSLDRALVGNRI